MIKIACSEPVLTSLQYPGAREFSWTVVGLVRLRSFSPAHPEACREIYGGQRKDEKKKKKMLRVWI